MIILDTNVISEILRGTPEPRVTSWLNAQAESGIVTTAINAAELQAGVEVMPAGRRKEELRGGISAMLDQFFAGRILPFDADAAGYYARIISEMRQKGTGISIPDAQIAAIATSKGADVATRDVNPFRQAGLHVINPWTEG